MAGCSSWTSKVMTEVLRMAELGHTADAQHDGLPLAGPDPLLPVDFAEVQRQVCAVARHIKTIE